MNTLPMEPLVNEGNDEIFVSIPSYRGADLLDLSYAWIHIYFQWILLFQMYFYNLS